MTTLIAAKRHPAQIDTKPQSAETAPAATWKSLYALGGAAAAAVLALIPIQAAAFVVWPPPPTVQEFFALFDRNAIAGLLALDGLLMVSWILSGVMFIGLYAALKRANESLMALAISAELIALGMYFSSNTAFSMLSLSQQYNAATADAERTVLLAAGQAMLALYTGTAFNVSYLLSGAAALIAAAVMLRSGTFSKAAAYVGILYGALQVIPPTAGSVGMVVSLLSLAPMVIWLILIARTLFRVNREMVSVSGQTVGA